MKYTILEFEERYFAGCGIEVVFDSDICPGSTWDTLHSGVKQRIVGAKVPHKYIGLECYPPDFPDSGGFDYYALIEIEQDAVQKEEDDIITKKVPGGKYICFEASLDTIAEDIQGAYKYCKDNDIKIHYGFDFEDYMDPSYNSDDIPLRFCIKLEE